MTSPRTSHELHRGRRLPNRDPAALCSEPARRAGAQCQGTPGLPAGRLLSKRHTLEDFGEAVRHFRRAIERDVLFTRAYTNLAYAYLMLPVLNAVLPSEFLPKARSAALRALEIDPQAGEAHIALALPFIQESRWREAGEEFRAGLELSPSDSLGRSWHGMYHVTLGHSSEALREHERALQLDPESPVTSYCYGQTLYLLRRYDEAAHYFRALALDPSLAGPMPVSGWSAYNSATTPPPSLKLNGLQR
jgi:tetratricopeptide (TPR) repeat protein